MKTNNNEPKYTQGEYSTNSYALYHLNDKIGYFCQIKIGNRIIADAFGKTVEEAESNAKRIVKAVNMHDELVRRSKLLADFATKVLTYPKGKMGYDPADKINLNNQIEKMDELLKQIESK